MVEVCEDSPSEWVDDFLKRLGESEYVGFTTHNILDDPRVNNPYVDFCFLGVHKGMPCLWVATMSTSASDYLANVRGRADECALVAYPYVQSNEPKDLFKKVGLSSCSLFAPSEAWREEHSTRARLSSELTIDYTNKLMYPIPAECVYIWPDYNHQIGLDIRKNVDFISLEHVTDFIESFNGVEYESDETFAATAEQLGISLEDGKHYLTYTRDFDSVPISM